MLLIVDEVQTGFGRTGEWFAVNHFGVVPDIVTLAKSIASGMPLSAVVGRAEVMDAPTKSRLGGTYAGNPVSCAAGLATLAYMEKENLPEKARQIGVKLTARMKRLQEKYPAIGDVRAVPWRHGGSRIRHRRTRGPGAQEMIHSRSKPVSRSSARRGRTSFPNAVAAPTINAAWVRDTTSSSDGTIFLPAVDSG